MKTSTIVREFDTVHEALNFFKSFINHSSFEQRDETDKFGNDFIKLVSYDGDGNILRYAKIQN